MASAAIAAPPMASTDFQSANNSFNAGTPYSQVGGSARWAGNRVHAMRRGTLLSSPDAPLLRILPKPACLGESTLSEPAPDCATPQYPQPLPPICPPQPRLQPHPPHPPPFRPRPST